MNKLFSFFKESYTEITEKVSWSPYKELQANTYLVLIASLLLALVIGGVDKVFDISLGFLYSF